MTISNFNEQKPSRMSLTFGINAIRSAFDIGAEGRIRSIDGLRVVAAMLVFNTHFFGYFFNRGLFADSVAVAFLRNGDIGVDLFFVISGYLMMSILSKGREDGFYFFARRALRLLPAQAVVLGFLIIGAPFFPLNFLANATFVAPLLPGTENLNPVTWSLTTELLFYATIFTAFRLAGTTRPRTVILLVSIFVAVAAPALQAAAGSGHVGHYTSQALSRVSDVFDLGRMAGFILGMCIVLVPPYRRLLERFALLLATILLVTLMIARTIKGDDLIHGYLNGGYFIASSIAFSVIVHSALGGILSRSRILSSLPAQILGKISYSFYLIHYPLCESIHLFFPNVYTPGRLILAYVGMFGLTTLLASLCYVHVERRYINLWRG